METEQSTVQAPPHEIAKSGLRPRRLALNAIAGFLNYGISISVGLWYTPYMLSKLPESTYSMVPLAASLTNYLAVMMGMVTASVSRYVTADLSRGDIQQANASFNSFIFAGLRLAGILLAVIVAFCLYLPLRIPEGYAVEARVVFFAILASFLLSSFGSCFVTSMWVTNRFDISNLIEATALIVRNGTVPLLFLFTQPDLWQVAVAVPLASMTQLSLQYYASRKLTPELKIDLAARTAATDELVFKVGRMLLLAHIGNQMLASTDLILVNRFLGPESVAKYAVVLVWANVLRSFLGSFGFLILPALVAYEATEDYQRLLGLSSRAMRLMGSVAAHGTGILSGLAAPILAVWLKKPWTHEVVPLVWLLLLPLSFEIATGSLTIMLMGPNRVKRYSIISLSCGIFGVLFAMALLQFTDLGFYGIAIATGIVSLIKTSVLYSILATAGTPVRWTFFLRPHLGQLLRFAATAAVGYGVAQYLQPSTIWGLCGAMIATAVIVLPPSIALLPGEDRAILMQAGLTLTKKAGL